MRHPSRSRRVRRAAALALAFAAAALVGLSCPERQGQQNFASPQSNPIAVHPAGDRVYVANTTSDNVDVIDTATREVIATVTVGVEPSGLAVRPDGTEVWVANHVSDSVSVIDANPGSPTYHRVIETVQDVDSNGATLFDEPVAVAFANDAKAYVSLSSTNDVAVVDTATYAVTDRIHITAQDPRAMAVQGNRLYVAAFESSNRTELSICPDGGSPPQCTLDVSDLVDFVIVSPNIPGADSRIVKDPQVPDRDLFVIDTATDQIVDVVEDAGTLLYGVAVSGSHEVFVTQADARNDVNGDFGDNLVDLDNRMFLNQITRVSCAGSCGAAQRVDLEVPPPAQPAPGEELATPYGVAVSGDGSTLVATAMGTSRLFTFDTSSNAVRGILDLNDGVAADFGQQIPKGVALVSDGAGAPQTAWVLNTLENTVSVVDVSDPDAPVHLAKVDVGSDRTPQAVRKGRIAFANAFASSSGTFSCESCHPDAHTDQLLWRIGGPCFFGDCTGDDEIRSTMPIRGLRRTVPLHWDGTLGDPIGGPDGSTGNGGNLAPNCTLGPDGDEHDCFLQLVGESLTGVMCDQDDGCAGGGELTTQERDDMASFLGRVTYPPARGRRMDDSVSGSALQGFADFFVDQGGPGNLFDVRTCADMDSGCHALPLGADTNSSTLAGFDAPTMRGMYDRTLQFSIGITNAEEVHEFVKEEQTFNIFGFPITAPATPLPYSAAEGYEEDVTFATAFTIFTPVYNVGPLEMFQMFEEASTGFSGAFARQVTLNDRTAGLAGTTDLVAALEDADARGAVTLRAVGARDTGSGFQPVSLSYAAGSGEYKGGGVQLTSAQVLAEAAAGDLVVTLTGELRTNFGLDSHPQPLLSVTGIGDGALGNPNLPVLSPGGTTLPARAVDLRENATIVLDGQPVGGTITCTSGSFSPFCSGAEAWDGTVSIALDAPPANGLHLLQVQNPDSALSNELPFCVGTGSLSICKDVN